MSTNLPYAVMCININAEINAEMPITSDQAVQSVEELASGTTVLTFPPGAQVVISHKFGAKSSLPGSPITVRIPPGFVIFGCDPRDTLE